MILENLFLGDTFDAKNLKFLKQNQISHILVVGSELEVFYPNAFIYLQIPAKDSEAFQLIDFFDIMSDFINKAFHKKGNVFVHCAMGVSRSPTAIIAYLMKYQKMTFKKALKHVESKRSIVFPNQGFLVQLEEYEKQIKSKKQPWKVEQPKKNIKEQKNNFFLRKIFK